MEEEQPEKIPKSFYVNRLIFGAWMIYLVGTFLAMVGVESMPVRVYTWWDIAQVIIVTGATGIMGYFAGFEVAMARTLRQTMRINTALKAANSLSPEEFARLEAQTDQIVKLLEDRHK